MRKLASLQKIISVNPIENADSIEKIQVLGWQLVAKKGEFKPKDWCVYIEVDSVLPERPEFEFLRNKNFHIKTIRLRGVISQGIAFPVSLLQNMGINLTAMEEGEDLTEIIGVTKYEPPVSLKFGGEAKGAFPSFIPETDETRIQSIPNFLVRNAGKRIYITEKMDGSSSTSYFKDEEFGVCSHHINLKENKNNIFWNIARKYNIENILKDTGKNISIQGEICGPGICGNKYKFKEHKLFIFNVFDIDSYEYYSYWEFLRFANTNRLETVPILYDNVFISNWSTVDDWVENSIGKSVFGDMQREGMVVRSMVEDTDFETGRLSFKVINPDFLLENRE